MSHVYSVYTMNKMELLPYLYCEFYVVCFLISRIAMICIICRYILLDINMQCANMVKVMKLQYLVILTPNSFTLSELLETYTEKYWAAKLKNQLAYRCGIKKYTSQFSESEWKNNSSFKKIVQGILNLLRLYTTLVCQDLMKLFWKNMLYVMLGDICHMFIAVNMWKNFGTVLVEQKLYT